MVSGAGFDGRLGTGCGIRLARYLGEFAYRLWSNFLGLPVLLGLLGLVVEWRRRPWVHLGLLLMLIGHVTFYVSYQALDKETMFLPAYLLWGIWIGLGARVAARWIAATIFAVPELPWLAPTALACLVALFVLVNYRYVDASADRSARTRGETILSALEPNAVFVGAWADLRLVEYLQQVEGQ